MAWRGFLVTACLLASTAGAPPALARPTPATSSVAWVRSEGAESCIGGKELAQQVERILGRTIFVSTSQADVAVEGRIEKLADGPGYRATIRVSDEHGTLIGHREVQSASPDCRQLDGSLAMIIAVMIDPDAESHPAPPPQPAPAPTPAPAPALTPTPTPAPSPARWRITAALGAAGVVALLPSFAWGGRALVRIGPPILGLQIGGTLLAPQDQSVPTAPGLSVRWTYFEADASLCPALPLASDFEVVGCAGIAAGPLTERPSGPLRGAQEATQVFVLGRLDARLEWRFASRFLASLGLGLAIPFAREHYTYADTFGTPQDLFSTPVLAGTGDLGVGVVFE